MINLIPTSLREERKYGRRNIVLRNIAFSCISVAIIIYSILLWSSSYISSQQAVISEEIADIEKTSSGLQVETKNISSLSQRVDNAYQLYESSINFSELIPQIGSLLPSGSNLTALNLTGGTNDPVQLNFELTSADLVPTVRQNLFSSELFEAVDIQSITSNSDTESQYKASSIITVSFTGSAEAKAKEAARLKAQAEARANAQAGGSN